MYVRLRSPLTSIVNTDVSRLDKLEHQLSELKDLICTRFRALIKMLKSTTVSSLNNQSLNPLKQKGSPRITNAKSVEKTQYRNVLSQKGRKMKNTLKTFQTIH